MTSRTTSVVRNPDFIKLWWAQGISEIGSRITREGLPLTAVALLGATPGQMGLLSAAATLPALFAGVFAGVWVDRTHRRPILIIVDLGRACILALVPISAYFKILKIAHLYYIALGTGILTTLFEVAYVAYLPSLVGQEHLQDGNSKLSLSNSTAEMLGPSLTGLLVQTFTAPIAILFDSISYLASAVFLAMIKKKEKPIEKKLISERSAGRNFLELIRYESRKTWEDFADGLAQIRLSPHLIALAGTAATFNFFGGFMRPLYVLYVVRDLHFSPPLMGFSITVGGLGALIGSFLATRTVKLLGLGKVLILSMISVGIVSLAIPFAHGHSLAIALICILVAQLFGDMTYTIYAINDVTLKQVLSPEKYIGRITATVYLVSTGAGAAGALVGGLIADMTDIHSTFVISALGIILSSFWIIFSPTKAIKSYLDLKNN